MKTVTRESYAKRIERVLDFLSTNIDALDTPLDIHRLAEEAFVSPYHFHRIYVAMMGETVADTIRRQRLHGAAVKLIASALSVAKIAEGAGYTSVAAFTRAFSEAYSIPPAKYRLHRQLTAALQRPQLTLAKEPKMSTHTFNLSDVTVKTMPAVRVAALQHDGDYQMIGESFGKLAAWAAGKGFLTLSTPSFGIYYDDPLSKPKNELRSEACLAAPQGIEGDGKVRMLEIASGRCAVMQFKGPYAELEKPYRWLYETWLPQSEAELGDAPPYEQYLNDARSTPPSELLTAICIPLKS
jgi:AraC family transcriptional regulator